MTVCLFTSAERSIEPLIGPPIDSGGRLAELSFGKMLAVAIAAPVFKKSWRSILGRSSGLDRGPELDRRSDFNFIVNTPACLSKKAPSWGTSRFLAPAECRSDLGQNRLHDVHIVGNAELVGDG